MADQNYRGLRKTFNHNTMMWEAPGQKPVPDEIIQSGDIGALVAFCLGDTLLAAIGKEPAK